MVEPSVTLANGAMTRCLLQLLLTGVPDHWASTA